MRIRRDDYWQRARKWRRAFALFPVRIHDEIVWLEWYWVRGTLVSVERARTEAERDTPYRLVSY